jgi:hypothetical protein
MAKGTVKWLNSEKGYGSSTPDNVSAGRFAHYTQIKGRSCQFQKSSSPSEVVCTGTTGKWPSEGEP